MGECRSVCICAGEFLFFFGGFLFINVSPTFPPQFQSLPSTPPKEGGEKKGLLEF